MRVTSGTLAALLLTLALGCGQVPPDAAGPPGPGAGTSGPTETGPATGAWTRFPGSPLSPRDGAVVAFVGSEVVVVGGYGGPPCPPTADCAFPDDAVEQDGAALDLDTGAWHRIADAPRPVPQFAPSAVIGTRLYLLVDDAVLVWDSSADAWTEISPPGNVRWSALVADGARLVMAPGSDENGVRPDRMLDTATGEWSTLPADPLKPAFDRTVTPTPEGLVLTAKTIEGDGSPADPSLVRAAVLPRGSTTWRVLPVSDQLGGWRWAWTGRHLVDPTLGGADGGATNNYGRVIPYGGRLDPATGDWSPLPDAPPERTGGWPVEALDGRLVAAEGWLFDDGPGTWTRLSRPPEAPAAPGPAAWAGRRLVVYGGADWDSDGTDVGRSADDVWSTDAWVYSAG